MKKHVGAIPCGCPAQCRTKTRKTIIHPICIASPVINNIIDNLLIIFINSRASEHMKNIPDSSPKRDLKPATGKGFENIKTKIKLIYAKKRSLGELKN